MQIWNEIKNFAKIEYAKVCVNKYTLFVGPNNCGKTFLLQLIEGINDAWTDIIDENALKSLCIEENEQSSIFEVSEDTISNFVNCVNKNIINKIDDIIFSTFGKKIDISEFKIDVCLEKGEKYTIYNSDNISVIKELVGQNEIPNIPFLNDAINISVIKEKKTENAKQTFISMSVSYSNQEEKWKYVREQIARVLNIDSIFMPASRNGLMLLYREFFAHKTDSIVSYKFSRDNVMEQMQESLNLTKYMYEFLRFLQLYKKDDEIEKEYEDVIRFFDEKIINGRISIDQQNGITYSYQNENGQVPMYLTSAMVNEVVPFYLAMTSNKYYERLVVDEIEASLHPQKQLEMVRFLNRLRNKNIQFIITTHSDTFVNRLNNLVVLSEFYKQTKDKSALEKLNVEEADLIDVSELFVYEFVDGENGKSVVEEKVFNPKSGYQFDLFTSTAFEVYQESQKLEDILESE